MENKGSVIAKAEEFVKRLHDKDIEINLEAQNFFLSKTEKKTFGESQTRSMSLAALIAESMFLFQEAKDLELAINELYKEVNKNSLLENQVNTAEKIHSGSNRRVNESANTLFRYVEIAYCHNLIDEKGLTCKLKVLEEENAKLREKNANLQKLNDTLAKQNDDLQKYFPDSHKRNGEIGDVTT